MQRQRKPVEQIVIVPLHPVSYLERVFTLLGQKFCLIGRTEQVRVDAALPGWKK